MRQVFTLFFLLIICDLRAQHCLWDCEGMIMLRKNISSKKFQRLAPVLVDGNKQVISDSVHGNGFITKDTCRFMNYQDFLHYRVNKIQLHSIYSRDTLYFFAKKYFIVRYRFCKYYAGGNGKLFVRFTDMATGNYRYIDVPDSSRIHLHDHHDEMGKKTSAVKRKKIAAKAMYIKWRQ